MCVMYKEREVRMVGGIDRGDRDRGRGGESGKEIGRQGECVCTLRQREVIERYPSVI